jgi:excisionase family DNA binding protein
MIEPIENAGRARKDWQTKSEIAGHLKCDIRTVTNLMRRGILPYVKIGRIVRLDLRECDQAMEKYKHQSVLR